jgi:hypothetical protein
MGENVPCTSYLSQKEHSFIKNFFAPLCPFAPQRVPCPLALFVRDDHIGCLTTFSLVTSSCCSSIFLALVNILLLTLFYPIFSVNSWMECDDLKLPVCQYTKTKPTMQPSEVHIVVWEREECCLGEITPISTDRNEIQTDIVNTDAEITTDPIAASSISTSNSSTISATTLALPLVTSAEVTPVSPVVKSTPCYALAPPPPASMRAVIRAPSTVMKTPEKPKVSPVVTVSPDVTIMGVTPSSDVSITQVTAPPDVAITHVTSPPEILITKVTPPPVVKIMHMTKPRAGVRRTSADSTGSAAPAKVPRLVNIQNVMSSTQPISAESSFKPVQTSSGASSDMSLANLTDEMSKLPMAQKREFVELMRQLQEIVSKYKALQERVTSAGETATTRAMRTQYQQIILNIIMRMPPTMGKKFFDSYQQNGYIAGNLVLSLKQKNQGQAAPAPAPVSVPFPGEMTVAQASELISVLRNQTFPQSGIQPVLLQSRPASTISQGQSPQLRGQLSVRPAAEKSYLKLVRPLLEKYSPALGKAGQQKSLYAGYVPLSQRSPDSSPGAVSTVAISTAAAATVTTADPAAAAATPRPNEVVSTYQQTLVGSGNAKNIVRLGFHQRMANPTRTVQTAVSTPGKVVVMQEGPNTRVIQQVGQSLLRPAISKVWGKIADHSIPSSSVKTSEQLSVVDLLRARDSAGVTSDMSPVATSSFKTTDHVSQNNQVTFSQPICHATTTTVQSVPSVVSACTIEATVAANLQKMASSTSGETSAFKAATSSFLQKTNTGLPSGNIVQSQNNGMNTRTAGLDVAPVVSTVSYQSFSTAAAATASHAWTATAGETATLQGDLVSSGVPVHVPQVPVVPMYDHNTRQEQVQTVREQASVSIPSATPAQIPCPISSETVPPPVHMPTFDPALMPVTSGTLPASVPVQNVNLAHVSIGCDVVPTPLHISTDPARVPVASKTVPVSMPAQSVEQLASDTVSALSPALMPVTTETVPTVFLPNVDMAQGPVDSEMIPASADPAVTSQIVPAPVHVPSIDAPQLPEPGHISTPDAAPVHVTMPSPLPITVSVDTAPAYIAATSELIQTPVAVSVADQVTNPVVSATVPVRMPLTKPVEQTSAISSINPFTPFTPQPATSTDGLGLGKRVRRRPARFLDDDESDSSSLSGKSPSRSSTGSSPKRQRGNKRQKSIERSASAAVFEVTLGSPWVDAAGRGRGRGRGCVERSLSTPILELPSSLTDVPKRGRGRARGRGRRRAANYPVVMDVQTSFTQIQSNPSHMISTVQSSTLQPATSTSTSQQAAQLLTPQAVGQTEQSRPRRQVKLSRKSLESLTPQQLEALKQMKSGLSATAAGELLINVENVRRASDGSLIIVPTIEEQGVEAAGCSSDGRGDAR